MSKSFRCFLPAPPICRSQNPGQRCPLSGVDHRQTNKQTRFSCNYGRGKDVHPSPSWSLATITSLLTYSPSLASIGHFCRNVYSSWQCPAFGEICVHNDKCNADQKREIVIVANTESLDFHTNLQWTPFRNIHCSHSSHGFSNEICRLYLPFPRHNFRGSDWQHNHNWPDSVEMTSRLTAANK